MWEIFNQNPLDWYIIPNIGSCIILWYWFIPYSFWFYDFSFVALKSLFIYFFFFLMRLVWWISDWNLLVVLNALFVIRQEGNRRQLLNTTFLLVFWYSVLSGFATLLSFIEISATNLHTCSFVCLPIFFW